MTGSVKMDMRLITLELRNFKGVKHFVLNAGGQNVSIRGDNATGKTTLYDAMLWLLHDKDSAGQANFEIKTLDKAGNVKHGLDHSVEGVFDLNGTILTLRKVYAEKYTKKRGSATQELTGHTTIRYIDSVPVNASEYKQRVAKISDEEIFKLLTNPLYFNEGLHWQDRRKTLLVVCGDIDDADVIASNDKLSPLAAIMGKRTIEELRN